ncbi:MAG: TraB/GumN family protein [Sphingomonas sp.]
MVRRRGEGRVRQERPARARDGQARRRDDAADGDPHGDQPVAGATITEQLPEDKRAAYAAALAEDGIPQAAIDHFDPWFAAVGTVGRAAAEARLRSQSGVEDQLSAAASAVNKPVIGLETAEQQLGYFDTLPVPLQVKYLVSTIDELPKMAAELDSMVTSWSAGDPDSLAKTLNEGLRDSPEIAKVLLADRNARWAKWIEARLAQPGTVFVAVGAGHLAGADSVQAFLANDKVRAERVDY